MEFAFAKRGIAKVYSSEILALIAGILLALSYMFVFVFGLIGGILTIIVSLAAIVLVIVAGIKELIGLSTAGKDERLFKTAFWVIILSLAVSLFGNLFPELSAAVTATTGIFDVISTVLICKGTANLFARRGDDEMVEKGKTTEILSVIGFALAAVLKILISLSVVATVIFGFFIILAWIVVEVIAYILFIRYLGEAKTKL